MLRRYPLLQGDEGGNVIYASHVKSFDTLCTSYFLPHRHHRGSLPSIHITATSQCPPPVIQSLHNLSNLANLATSQQPLNNLSASQPLSLSASQPLSLSTSQPLATCCIYSHHDPSLSLSIHIHPRSPCSSSYEHHCDTHSSPLSLPPLILSSSHPLILATSQPRNLAHSSFPHRCPTSPSLHRRRRHRFATPSLSPLILATSHPRYLSSSHPRNLATSQPRNLATSQPRSLLRSLTGVQPAQACTGGEGTGSTPSLSPLILATSHPRYLSSSLPLILTPLIISSSRSYSSHLLVLTPHIFSSSRSHSSHLLILTPPFPSQVGSQVSLVE